MAWIESHQEIGRHPKTKRLAAALNLSVPTVIGHIHLLWWWALDFAQDGGLGEYTDKEIAEAAMYDGEPETFVRALVHAGFFDDTDHGLVIHDWHDYAGKLIEQREKNAEKQRAWRQKRNDNNNGNITVMSPSRNGATVPDRTGQNSTVPDNMIAVAPSTPVVVVVAEEVISPAPNGSHEPPPQETHSAELNEILELFGAKRFPTPANRQFFVRLLDTYGADEGVYAARKAAERKRKLSDTSYIEAIAKKRKEERDRAAYYERYNQDIPDPWDEPAETPAATGPPAIPKGYELIDGVLMLKQQPYSAHGG